MPRFARGRRSLRNLPEVRSKESQRSEEHTSELQSLRHLVCRLLLDPRAAQIYSLSLHDALPICRPIPGCGLPGAEFISSAAAENKSERHESVLRVGPTRRRDAALRARTAQLAQPSRGQEQGITKIGRAHV